MPQGVLDGAAADRSHASCIVHLRTNSLTVAAAAAACCCLLSLSLLLSLLSQANQLEPPGATELLVPAGAAVVWRTAVWHCVSTHTHTPPCLHAACLGHLRILGIQRFLKLTRVRKAERSLT